MEVRDHGISETVQRCRTSCDTLQLTDGERLTKELSQQRCKTEEGPASHTRSGAFLVERQTMINCARRSRPSPHRSLYPD